MKKAAIIPAMATAFALAGAAVAEESRYEFINGTNGFSSSHRDFEGNGDYQFINETTFFYALIRDHQESMDILCSGFKIKTAPGTNADDHLPYTSSPTVSLLWQKVDEDVENLAQYGSCIEVDARDLKEQTTQFIYDSGFDYRDVLVLLTDPPPADYSSHVFENFFQTLAEGIEDALTQAEQEKGGELGHKEALEITIPFEQEFARQVEAYLDREAYSPLSDAYECPNAGFYWEQIDNIAGKKHDNTALPLCNLLPAP